MNKFFKNYSSEEKIVKSYNMIEKDLTGVVEA